MDGVEIGKGLAAIDGLREAGEIDGYYASAAKRAYLERIGEMPARAAPFQEPSPFGMLLSPGALKRRFKGVTGEDVGASVAEACRCTPRPFDAIDPISGWGIYYVKGGVLLTPSLKCVAGGGRPLGFFERTFRNLRAIGVPDAILPELPSHIPPPPEFLPPPPPPSSSPPSAPRSYLCMDPRIVPLAWRPQPTPCEAPKIPYPG